MNLKMRSGKRKNYYPFLAACLFFLVSVCLYAGVGSSSEKQAERIIKKIYTVSEEEPLALAAPETFPGIFLKKYKGELTEAGMQSAVSLGLPLGLLGGDAAGKVTRTCAVRVTLTEEKKEEQEAVYRYQVEVESRYRKEMNALAPVKTNLHSGWIRLKKTGFLKWRADKIEVG